MKSCYIHVPFCKDICSYCDFTRCRFHQGLADKWLAYIKSEIKERLSGVQLDTIYIGGGTPNALSNKQLQELLNALAPYTKNCLEYTIELNVELINKEQVVLLKKQGINRVSLGIQSVQEDLLKRINRHHNKEMIVQAISLLHENGIHNISGDLIYALPTQSMRQWLEDLDFITSCDVTHISLYSLILEEHSAFGRSGVQPMEEEQEADMFETAINYLEKKGFEHYEISNFAKDNKRSLHNQVYWNYGDFIGLGCGASGKENHQRYDNTKNLQLYFEKGNSPTIIPLNKQEEMFEHLMMSLRLKEGLNLTDFQKIHKENFMEVYGSIVKDQIALGYLCLEKDYLHTTQQGMMLLNDVLVAFLPED